MYSPLQDNLGEASPASFSKPSPTVEPLLPGNPPPCPGGQSEKEVPCNGCLCKEIYASAGKSGPSTRSGPVQPTKRKALNDPDNCCLRYFMPVALVPICDHCGTAGRLPTCRVSLVRIKMLSPALRPPDQKKPCRPPFPEHIMHTERFSGFLLIQGIPYPGGTGPGPFKARITEPLFLLPGKQSPEKPRDHTRRPLQEYPL